MLFASVDASKLIRGRCPARERRDERPAKVVRLPAKPSSSQCNVRLCETRYSTTRLRPGQCGQIHETLKGSAPPSSAITDPDPRARHCSLLWHVNRANNRSEEHTSELQSLMRISYAVFCLKKKTNSTKKVSHITQT